MSQLKVERQFIMSKDFASTARDGTARNEYTFLEQPVIPSLNMDFEKVDMSP